MPLDPAALQAKKDKALAARARRMTYNTKNPVKGGTTKPNFATLAKKMLQNNGSTTGLRAKPVTTTNFASDVANSAAAADRNKAATQFKNSPPAADNGNAVGFAKNMANADYENIAKLKARGPGLPPKNIAPQ